MKRTIILINSMGHSGSTILDKYLGSLSDDIFSTGELINLHKTIRTDNYCSCGAKICSCFYWSRIIEEMKLGGGYNNNNDDYSSKEYLNTLYRTIFKITKKSIIIDSSKNIMRTIWIKKHLSKYYDVILLHLIRDPRGVFISYRKKQWHLPKPVGDHPSTGIRNIYKGTPRKKLKIILKWILKNMQISIIKRIFFNKQKIINCFFDDFTEKQTALNNKINEIIDLGEVVNQPVKIGRIENHIVNGNASRFYEGYIKNIKNEWKNKISKFDLLWIKIITFIPMIIYKIY